MSEQVDVCLVRRHTRNIKVAGDAVPGIMRGLAKLTWIPPDAVA